MRAEGRTRQQLVAGIAAPACVWLVSLLLGAVSPGYDPVRRSISALANTPAGGLMSVAFIVTGGLELAFAVGISRVLGISPRQRVAVRGVITVLAVLTLLFALFPTDPPGIPRTTVGRVHLLVALGYAIALPASLIVFGLIFGRDDRWRRYRSTTLAIALVEAVLFPFLVAAVSGDLRPWLGIVERLYFGIPSMWQAWVAWHALKDRRSGDGDPGEVRAEVTVPVDASADAAD